MEGKSRRRRRRCRAIAVAVAVAFAGTLRGRGAAGLNSAGLPASAVRACLIFFFFWGGGEWRIGRRQQSAETGKKRGEEKLKIKKREGKGPLIENYSAKRAFFLFASRALEDEKKKSLSPGSKREKEATERAPNEKFEEVKRQERREEEKRGGGLKGHSGPLSRARAAAAAPPALVLLHPHPPSSNARSGTTPLPPLRKVFLVFQPLQNHENATRLGYMLVICLENMVILGPPLSLDVFLKKKFFFSRRRRRRVRKKSGLR